MPHTTPHGTIASVPPLALSIECCRNFSINLGDIERRAGLRDVVKDARCFTAAAWLASSSGGGRNAGLDGQALRSYGTHSLKVPQRGTPLSSCPWVDPGACKRRPG